MDTSKLKYLHAVIYVMIAVVLLGNTLFCMVLSTDNLKTEIENETKLLALNYAERVNHMASLDATFPASSTHQEEWFILPEEDGDDIAVWLLDNDGTILQRNDLASQANLPSPVYGQNRTMWLGESRLLLKQDCVVVMVLLEGKCCLVVQNHCTSAKALQRNAFALVGGLDLIVFVVMVILIFNVISGYRRQMILLATTDELTGLSNRKSFRELFNEFIADANRPKSSLFLLDIDYFKQINDGYGHASGDEALKILASHIADIARKTGGFAGRWGGDEFIGVLPMPGEQACVCLSGLCAQIDALKPSGGYHMTISVGVTSLEGEMDLGALSEKADEALYASKQNGRNRVTVHHDKLDKEGPIVHHVVAEAVAAADDVTLPQEPVTDMGQMEMPSDTDRDLWHSGRIITAIILGVRWMTPFIAGGGILIALAFLFDAASIDLSTLSATERSALGSITPLAATLKNIGGTIFNFMLPIFAGFMAYGLAGEEAFMAGFAGGFMTIESNAGFVGAMIAGLAAGIMTRQSKHFFRYLPQNVQRAATLVFGPVLNLLLMRGLALLFIAPLSGMIGQLFQELLDKTTAYPIVSCAFSSSMMALDMGGIINKVAYNHGVSSIVLGDTGVMAAVMAGGMVPPIGIALAMALFPDRFEEQEKERRAVTFCMGLSFITEGALPFVFTDVFRVIPSCVVGSFIAGALSEFFGCRLPAPHGGIFVLPVMEHPWLYIMALLMGSLATAIILGLLKKHADKEQMDGNK